jgi:hypothetical protein
MNGINFGKSASHRVDEKNEFRVDYVGNNPFQQTNLPVSVDDSSKSSQLIVKFILIPHSEGEFYLLKSEGARAAPNHLCQLIVASISSKISFHFCNDCRIFCEGVKGAATIPYGLFDRPNLGLWPKLGLRPHHGRWPIHGLWPYHGWLLHHSSPSLQLQLSC